MNQSNNDITGAIVGQGSIAGGDVTLSQRKIDQQSPKSSSPFKLNLVQKRNRALAADPSLGVIGSNATVKNI